MRYLGNKTKLLDDIASFMMSKAITGKTMLDVFAGTASVARFFRRQGWVVHANDLLAASYARQRTYVALGKQPRFPGGLMGAVQALNKAPPRRGLVARQFGENGPMRRLYFSAENAARIDGAWVQLISWWRDGTIDEDGFYVLLVALLEAADRVANISGTYGAFLKKLNANALKPLTIQVPKLDMSSPPGQAHRKDANALVEELEVDVLYLDPPYNGRQYAKYYHLPEILAELHEQESPESYEAGLYGKTGLRPFRDRLSNYCRKQEVSDSFADLVGRARTKWIVLSYSEEGILSYEEIVRTLETRGRVEFRVVNYKRFRSDSEENREVGSSEVMEWIFSCRVVN